MQTYRDSSRTLILLTAQLILFVTFIMYILYMNLKFDRQAILIKI